MRRAAIWIALLAAAGAAALLLVPKEPPPSAPLRPAPAVGAPDVEQKVAYFYGVLRDAGTVDVTAPIAGAAPTGIPVWREIGWPALLALGQPALDYLTSPARYPEYVAAPNLLVTVLQLLAEAPPFPGRFPFLAHWLDETNCPPAAAGSDWPDEIRVYVFAALKTHPDPSAVPICVQELLGPRGKHDLRGAAIDILLRVGQAEALNGAFRTLPPTPDTPSPDLRTTLLDRLFHMAAPGATEESRAQVKALEPLVREALGSPRAVERFHAMGVLWRLGRPGMEQELERFFEENREDETLAWSALLLLAADGPHPFVHEACLARVERPDKGVGFTTAVQILGRLWIAEIEERLLDWMSRGDVDPYMELPALLRHDRERVVAWLRVEVRTDDQARLLRALRFIAGERITELAGDLLARVRELDPPQRPPLYGTLVALRAPGTGGAPPRGAVRRGPGRAQEQRRRGTPRPRRGGGARAAQGSRRRGRQRGARHAPAAGPEGRGGGGTGRARAGGPRGAPEDARGERAAGGAPHPPVPGSFRRRACRSRRGVSIRAESARSEGDRRGDRRVSAPLGAARAVWPSLCAPGFATRP